MRSSVTVVMCVCVRKKQKKNTTTIFDLKRNIKSKDRISAMLHSGSRVHVCVEPYMDSVMPNISRCAGGISDTAMETTD